MNVFLTRRREECEASASNLTKAGLNPITYPLSELVILDCEFVDHGYDFLIFTSKAGVSCFNDREPKKFDKPVYSVGEKTTNALLAKGYKNIRTGTGTAQDLAGLIKAEQPPQAKALYVCGQNRAFDMEKALAEKNISVDVIVGYQIIPVTIDEQEFRNTLSRLSGCFIMLYSPKSAKNFFDIVKKCGAENLIKDAILIAISKKTSLASDLTLVKDHHIAKIPSEQSMIETALEIVDLE